MKMKITESNDSQGGGEGETNYAILIQFSNPVTCSWRALKEKGGV